MKLLQRSLVARIIASLLAISSMVVISIVVTIVVAGSSRGDAAAINMAGSLRMNTYQIVASLQRYQQQPGAENRRQVQALTDHFDSRLTSLELTNAIPDDASHALQEQHQLIIQRWEQELSPRLKAAIVGESVSNVALNQRLDGLVADIETLVTLLEQNTEAKIRLLSVLQLLFLGLTIAVVVIALFDIRHNLTRPLHQLVVLAREAAQRNFQYRTHLKGSDELALLGRTFDGMSEELAASYAAL
ncbi:type IV pili methyl-accepting chemotaxis transducer N-terminal domain-containing protein, partial [Vreelandella rituensis]